MDERNNMTEGNTINGLALCAGNGGLELALHIAEPRLRSVCYVEREAGAAASIVARMEDQVLDQAPIWDDVGTFDGRPWRGVVDILTSGDPCQPNSAAGKRQGADDDRWLLDQVIRIIDETRPSRVFRENVPGNADGQLRVLIPALEGMGYRPAAGIFSAAGVGASQRRERLFIMADAIGGGHDWRAHDAQWRALERAVAQGTGGAMANAQGIDGRRELEAEGPRGRWPGPTGSGEGLADASGGGCGKFGHAAQPGRGGHIDRGHADVAHPDSAELRPNGGEPHTEADRRNDTPRGGAELAVTNSAGLEKRLRGADIQAAVPSIERCGVRLLAPAPGDDTAWSAVLDLDWALRPALGPIDLWTVARRRLCLPPVVDPRGKGGMAQGLDQATAAELKSEVCRISSMLAHRNDRLRRGGNGVHALEGAYAYTALAALLDAAGTGSTDAVLSVA